MKNLLSIILMLTAMSACQFTEPGRQELSLNGEWEITKTDSFTDIPTSYSSETQVPGLVDMAVPSLDEQDTDYENAVYWHRRNFQAEEAEVIRLKINKAKYHTKVFVNDQLVGDNVYSFTPAIFDVKPYLNPAGQANEVVIAVGCKNNLPDTVVNGSDFEKIKYIPGIYDDVQIIASGYPFIQNVQLAPDIDNGAVRVVAEIETSSHEQNATLTYEIRELVTQKVVSTGSVDQSSNESINTVQFDFQAQLSEVNLWTPENPFLYEIKISTGADDLTTRFGMRTFSSTKESDVFLLNGKPYYMRGTNVCIYRFFEDPNRNGLPWDNQWSTKLHQRFKDMNWNSIRYCIGFPPERWYEIADSLGFLIQDEFPIWTGTNKFEELQKKMDADHLAMEYEAWMRERWNHPSVAIWDAQNESVTEVTGRAIKKVRHLDLSNRPWDNGYAAPDNETDAIESHPYLFVQYSGGGKPSKDGALKDLLSEVHVPANDPNEHSPLPDGSRFNNPIIVNEYAWLWLNRDGTPTTLTDLVYKNAFPEAVTKEQKYEAYARHMAILSEYWRAHRKCAAVMHFCGLGYSRSQDPRGQTSDNFIDLQELTYEPQFYKYVKSAFSPVGLMVELWDKSFDPGEKVTVPVHLINDLEKPWAGTLRLVILKEDEKVSEEIMEVSAGKYEKALIELMVEMPEEKGNYQIEAQIDYEGEVVKSIRQFRVD